MLVVEQAGILEVAAVVAGTAKRSSLFHIQGSHSPTRLARVVPEVLFSGRPRRTTVTPDTEHL